MLKVLGRRLRAHHEGCERATTSPTTHLHAAVVVTRLRIAKTSCARRAAEFAFCRQSPQVRRTKEQKRGVREREKAAGEHREQAQPKLSLSGSVASFDRTV